jgi:membrane-bound serine protease (ClpP class)
MRKPIAIFFGLVVAAISSLLFAQPATRGASPQTQAVSESRPAAVISIRGAIDDYSRHSFMRRLDQARALGAKVIIVELDTPGGAVGAALELTHTLRNLSDLHTIAWINPRAYSAGTMIALACNEVIMVPGGVIGDCAPIRISDSGELQPLPPTERAKFASPVLADFVESAKLRGYDPALVEAMVIAERVVYLLEDSTGHRRAVGEEQYRGLTATGQWKLVPGVHQPIDAADTLLTVSTDTAILLGLAKSKAGTIEELAAQRNLQIVATLDPAAGEQLVEFLNAAWVRTILLSIFLTALYAVLHAPGHGLAEAIALVTLSLLLGVPLLTGYAQWWEIAAIFLGIILLALEIFVIPGFGVAGIIGIVLVLGGFLLTFIAPEPGPSPFGLPRLAITWSAIQQGLLVIVSGMFCSLLLSTWLRRYLPRLPYFKNLVLTTTVGSSESAMVGSLTNIDPLSTVPAVGSTGRAVTDLLPGGSVEFRDLTGASHMIAVVSDSGFIPRGARIIVREAAGNHVVVYPAETGEKA